MRWIIPATLLTLAACGGGEEAANNGAADEAATAIEPVPSNATIDPQNRVVPLPTPSASPSPVVAQGFPAAFQGRWGMVPNDCDPTRSDTKGLMTVAADRVSFYESRGVPTRIEVASPGRLTAELAFTGEGMEWTKRARFTLIHDGQTLIREESDPAGSFRYQRCPA